MSFPMNSMSTGGETLHPPVECEADGVSGCLLISCEIYPLSRNDKLIVILECLRQRGKGAQARLERSDRPAQSCL